jgi:D-mannonate dehydratase
LLCVIAADPDLWDGRGYPPKRPDYWHLLADGIDKGVNPGYSQIGRLKGLAGLSRVMHGSKHAIPELATQ